MRDRLDLDDLSAELHYAGEAIQHFALQNPSAVSAHRIATRLLAEVARLSHVERERDAYREIACYAFDYVDAPDGSDRIEEAWYAMKSAIGHWRKTGGPDPRVEAEIDQRVAASLVEGDGDGR